MIKCNSCGRDCRIGTEQVGIDDRGIPVYHRFAYCDSCMMKYDLDIEPEERCPRCGNLMFPYQTQCLNCGLKLVTENGEPIIHDTPFLSSKSSHINIAAILSMIFGIIGLITSCTNVGILFCGLALLLAICVLGYKENNKGMAIAGLVLGLVGVVIGGSKEMLKQDRDDKSRYESSYDERDQKDYVNNSKPSINENSEIETGTETQEEAEQRAATQAEADAKREAEEKLGYETGITYDQLARTPDDYEGSLVKFTGEVIQTLEEDGQVDIRLAVDGEYNNILYCAYESNIVSSRVLEGDTITIYGTSMGLYSYESTTGVTITIPCVWVDKIDQ